jgi:hypothetical protein
MYKTLPIAVTLTFVVLSNHASAASPKPADICFNKASQKSFNFRGEREQFMANCIADLTPAPAAERGQYEERQYQKRQY